MELQREKLNSKSKNIELPVLAAYTDFRKYLLDFYECRREQTKSELRPYSYAHFSAAADIKSPNYLKLIIEGRRNLSKDSIRKFAKALMLNKAETDEFTILVNYGQAQDPLERNRYLRDLADIRVKMRIKAGELKKEQYENIPSWIVWAIHALVEQKGVNFGLEDLRETLLGRATKEEISKALDYLSEAGAISTEDNGQSYSKKIQSIPTPANIPPSLVRKLQSELIYLGMETLFEGDPQDREFGSLTLALTEAEYERLKFELRHLRKRILKDTMVEREKGEADRVFQMNIQLFPISKNTAK